MEKVIQGLYYTKEHDWVKVKGSIAYVGITDHAQAAMGDFVYADCGAAGASVSAGDAIAVLESVKAASDINTPVSGTVCEINEALADAPELLNQDPYEHFLFAVDMTEPGELDGLMDAAAYQAFCAGEAQ